jgi:hypothetical protein
MNNSKFFLLLFWGLSCSKFEGDTIVEKEVSLREAGSSEITCSKYLNVNYFRIDGDLYICTNMPDSLNNRSALAYKYIIDYRVYISKESCMGDLAPISLYKLELYKCQRK